MNNNPFNPPKKEVLVKVQITAKEAQLLRILRGINFGKIVIQKMAGQLVRVEPSESILLSEDAGIALVSGNEFEDSLLDKPLETKK